MKKIYKTSSILFVILIVIYSIRVIYSHHRQKIIKDVISNLEKHKSKTGKYPLKNTFDSAINNGGWFYYYPDSTRQSYTLSYSQGIISINTLRYYSETKKWEEKFNY